MSKWSFYCSKCHRQFTVNAIEGTKVDCHKCGNILDVPVYNGLEPIQPIANDILGALLQGVGDKGYEYREGGGVGDVLFKRLTNNILDKVIEGVTKPPKRIICVCSFCDQKYRTNIDNVGCMGKCHKCEKDFNIKQEM